MIDTKLMSAAIQKWGVELQTNLAMEECAELIAAIAHYKRGREYSRQHLIEEIADVKIMVYQLEIMFGRAEVDAVVDAKMQRLEKRLGCSIFNGNEVVA